MRQKLLMLLLLLTAWGARAQAPTWQSTLSSTAVDVRAVAMNANGDVFVTGSYTGSVTFGSNTLNSTGDGDVFVAKWAAGASTWAWGVSAGGGTAGNGGDANDFGNAIAVNGNRVYVTGQYRASTFSTGAGTLTNAGGYDMFLAKFTDNTTSASASGLLGSSGGASQEYAYGVDVNPTTGNVYVTGYFGSTASPNATISGTALASGGSADVYVAKYFDNGTTLSNGGAIRAGGTSGEVSTCIALNGNTIYIAGRFNSGGTGTAVFGSTTLNNGGGNDIFVARFSDTTPGSTGGLTVQNALRGGGDQSDGAQGIVVSNGSIYVTGYFISASSVIAGSTLGNAGGSDMFLAKYTDTGSALSNGYAIGIGGSNDEDVLDASTGADIDVSGTNVYITSDYTTSATIAGTALTSAGGSDVFVARFTDNGAGFTNGGAVSGGGAGTDRSTSIAVNGTQGVAGGAFVAPATFGSTTLSSGTAFAGRLSFAAPPTVTTAAASTITSTSAVLGGNVTADGGAAVTDRGVVYSTTNQTPAIGSGTQNSNGSGTGSFSETITGLTPSTTYYVRAYAINSVGTSYGGVQTFTTAAALPTVTTAAATSITASSAVLGGNVTADGGATVTGRGVVYSLTSANSTPTIGGTGVTQAANGSGTGSFSATISGLAPGTSYSVQAYATNSTGTSYGGVQTFTTAAAVPTVTTAAPTSITTTSAVLGGNVTADGGASVTGRGVVYSLTSANGTPTIGGTGVTQAANGSGTGSFSATILGLAPGTSYSVRAYAINSVGTSYGGVQTFTTAAALPTVTTAAATSITTTSAVLGGNVTADGGASVTGRGVVYSTSNTTPTVGGTGVTQAANGSGTGSFSATISGLASGTTYYAQAYATNSAGTSYGGVQTFTTTVATATVVSITRQTPSPTATTQVRYLVVFSSSVANLSVSNFSLTTTGLTGASVSSASGSGTTYTVTVNTGTGDGTLRLDVANSTGISPTVTNVPYTAGEQYTITKSFAAAPTLRIQAAGSASGNSDVTAFVDVVQVVQNGTSTVVANGLRNGSFETNNVSPSNFLYQSQGVVASPWSFGVQAGVSRNNSAFGSTAADGDAVALLQSATGDNGSVTQNLAVPTGNYQVSFRAMQRNYTSLDQRLNVFVNDVFVGTIQPNNIPTYDTFTSAAFSVTAPALTATVSTTSASPTSTSPVPFSVSFSQSVGTTFTASDVTVAGGTLTSGSFSGSGAGPYTFTVTPSGSGTVTVSLAANVATDANNTGNSTSNSVSVQFQAPTITVSPATLPNGTVGVAYSQTISASGGSGTYTYAITSGALPSGLTLTSAGALSGTPTASGTFNFRVTATDNSAAPGPYSGFRDYSLTISAPTISVSPATLPNGTVGVAYSQTISASGGSAPYRYAITAGATPNGLTISTTGVLSGTPTVAGTFNFTVTATDAFNSTGSQAYSVTISAPTITVSPATLPNGTVAAAYSQTLTASGGSGTYSYAITAGALSPGLTLNSAGVLSGTPTASGSFTFTVTATDGFGSTGSRSYTLVIGNQPVTAAPVVTAPANGSLLTTTTPTYQGTAPAGSTVTVYVDGTSIGTTTATGGSFSLAQPTALAQGSHTVYATAQTSGSAVSANSNTNTFTVDTVRPTVAISSSAGASGGSTSTSPIPFTVTFSESVTGFSASGITVTNGTIGAITGSGTTYTFSVTPTTVNTATTVAVAANAAQDQAGNGNTASSTFSLTYTVTLTSWTGAVSTDWFTSGNWTAGVPTAAIDATIPASVPRYPLITAGTAPVRSLTVNSGATLNQTGGVLNVNGNLTNNGTLTLTGGAVALGSSTLSNILGSSNTRFWELTVGANGAQLSTSASTSVQRVATLNGAFATNGNPFTLESNSNSTAMLVNNGSNVVSGNVTVQRYITPDLNPNLGYRHFSSAISTATVAGLTTGSFSPVVNPAYNTSATPATVRPFPTVYGYDQSRLATATNNLPTFDKGWFSPSALSSSLTVGQGYTVNLVANQTLSLTGPQNNGNIPLTLSRNSDATAADAGLALVGNPYPSPLNWQQVDATDRPGLDGVIYVFNSNDPSNPYAGSYSFYNNNIGNISPVLPLGQGFFVRVSQGQTSATLTLKNSHRPTTYAGTTYRRTAAETRPLVQLSLKATGSSVSDDAFVYFEKGATDGFDSQFDAIKLPNTNGLNISTSITGKQLSIDGRDELGKVQRVVPLAVGVPAAGTYTFTTAQLLNLDTTPVYLRDLQLGTLTDLRLTPSYQFTVTNSSALITNRFELVFSPQQALATVSAALSQQVALYPNPAKTAAFVELPASLGRQAVTATLLDALGREVRSVVLPAQGAVAHQLDLHELATGVYALRLSTSAGVVVKRLTVE